MKYLVALGEEDEVQRSRVVLDAALRHAIPGRDCLLLTRIVEEVKPDPSIVLLDILCDDEEQMRVEEEARKKLEAYDPDCKAAGVDCAFLVISANHAGSAICKAAKDHKADCIVLGRRELGMIKRMITSSTSKYCMDHAECNVIVIKRPYTEHIAHSLSSQHIQPMGKEERDVRQMASEKTQQGVMHNKIFTLRDPAEMQKAFAHTHPENPQTQAQQEAEKASRDIRMKELAMVHRLEEQERMERMQCQQREAQMERMAKQEESLHDLELVKNMEEEERKERMRMLEEEKRKAREERHQESMNDRKLIAQLEEEERSRRIKEWDEEKDQERAQRSLERTASLEKLRLAEEQERMDRMLTQHEEDERERVMTRARSQEFKVITKHLEDEERERRIKEAEEARKIRAQESKAALAKVKAMEEEERNRRIHCQHLQE